MATLGLEFGAKWVDRFQRNRDKLLTIESVRLGFMSAILFLVFIFELRQKNFIAYGTVVPVYALLAAAFLANACYLLWYENLRRLLPAFTGFLFVIDTLFVSGLILATGLNQSVFLLLYLVNIVLCGFLYQKQGAYILAAFTSIVFSLTIALIPEVKGQTLLFMLGLNNLAFFTVAILSGTLSEQLNIMGRAIAEQKQDIAVLEDLNRLIVDNIASGLMTIDTNGRILHSNSTSDRLLANVSAETPLGRHIEDYFPQILKVIESQQYQFENDDAGRFDWNLEIDEDTDLILDFSVSVMKGSLGSNGQGLVTTGYILIYRDMTQIKKLERAMQRSEKLAAVGQLAAGVAHEIRNPLASISGSIQMLKAMGPDEKDSSERLMTIVLREIDRLNVLITEFLEYSRADKIPKEDVDLDALVKEVSDMCKVHQNLRQDVEQVVELQCGRHVIAHYGKLKQVLLNLMINAYQALEKADGPKVTVRTELKNEAAWVHIQDNGTGIDPKNLEKIFEPFHTTKPKGTGLGLATAHKIIENHEGEIHVRSELEMGTTFSVELRKLALLEQNIEMKVNE
jgi:two-component system sensor histidine kinase PilS (NtrC family)